jgi:hypothetical protein
MSEQARQLRFWSLMPGYARDACYKLRLGGWALYPTGSRYICPGHARADSDWDVVVLGGALCGSIPIHEAFTKEYDNRGSGDGSIRIGDLNLIYLEADEFHAWIEATRYCLDDPKAIERDYRVRVFKTMVEMSEKQAIHEQLDAIMANRGKHPIPTGKRPPWLVSSTGRAIPERLSKP